MFVVLSTNTSHENAAFGPFDDEDEALEARRALGEADVLHEFMVLEVQEVPEEEEADEEE